MTKKGKKEPVSDVVIKVTEKELKKNLSEFSGKWKGSREEIDKIFEEILMKYS